MSDAQGLPEPNRKQVICPECGDSFSPRGISSHRKIRHGIAPEAAVELAGALSKMATILERLEVRLTVAGASDSEHSVDRVPAPLPAARPLDGPAPLLQEGLSEVLAEIARVKRDTEAQIAALRDLELSDEQRTLEQTAFHTLASLRRRQADLLYRLQSEQGSNGNGIDALSTL